MEPEDKVVLGCTGAGCAFVLLAFAAVVFIVAGAIKWVMA